MFFVQNYYGALYRFLAKYSYVSTLQYFLPETHCIFFEEFCVFSRRLNVLECLEVAGDTVEAERRLACLFGEKWMDFKKTLLLVGMALSLSASSVYPSGRRRGRGRRARTAHGEALAGSFGGASSSSAVVEPAGAAAPVEAAEGVTAERAASALSPEMQSFIQRAEIWDAERARAMEQMRDDIRSLRDKLSSGSTPGKHELFAIAQTWQASLGTYGAGIVPGLEPSLRAACARELMCAVTPILRDMMSKPRLEQEVPAVRAFFTVLAEIAKGSDAEATVQGVLALLATFRS